MQMCIMFSLGVKKALNSSDFIKKWFDLLTKLDNHSSLKRFEECFLSYYSWDFFYLPKFFQQVEQIFFDLKFAKL